MEKKMELGPVGTVECDEEGFKIAVDRCYSRGLTGLCGFSHILVLWWFNKCDNEGSRSRMINDKPYTNGPNKMGTFATRSPERPNPIAVSVCGIEHIDVKSSSVYVDYIDAIPGTPVLDIKPYTPSADRVENPEVPRWCSHWPKSYEESGNFDWEKEFSFRFRRRRLSSARPACPCRRRLSLRVCLSRPYRC